MPDDELAMHRAIGEAALFDDEDVAGDLGFLPAVPDASSLSKVNTLLTAIPKPEHHEDLVQVCFR